MVRISFSLKTRLILKSLLFHSLADEAATVIYECQMHEWVKKGALKTILTKLSHHKFPFRQRTVLLTTTATINMDCLRHRLLAVSKGSSVPARPLTLSLLHVVFVVLLLCPCVIVFVGGSSSETTACETRTVDSLPPPNFSKASKLWFSFLWKSNKRVPFRPPLTNTDGRDSPVHDSSDGAPAQRVPRLSGRRDSAIAEPPDKNQSD